MKISDMKSERRFDDSMSSISSSKYMININRKNGVKILSRRGRKIVRAGERLWRPYASDGAMRTDDDDEEEEEEEDNDDDSI